MLPPWRKYPDNSPYSICWRMGSGEDYITAWSQWWETECSAEADRMAYLAAAEPPTDWLEWAGTAIWPDVEEEEAVARLGAHGIGDYHMWRSWTEALDASSGGPVVFLDVDGTLVPLGTGDLVADPSLGPLLAALPADLVWATAWMADANDHIAPQLGLPTLPVFDWSTGDDDRPPGRAHWKTRGLLGWAAARPFVWIDDEITDADREWIASATDVPALLHRVVDPYRGVTAADLDVVAEWLARTGNRD